MRKRIYFKAAFVFMLITFLSAAVSCKQAHPGPLFPFDDGSDNFGSYGAIDSTGNIIIKPQFSRLYPYSEGLMLADFPERKYRNMSQSEVNERNKGLSYESILDKKGFIDTNGKVVISFDRYLAAWPAPKFSDGLSLIKQNDYYGYIDKSGKFAIQPKYKEAKDFSDGVAFVSIEVPIVHDELSSETFYGVIDKKGEWVIEPQFLEWRETISKFENGLAPVNQTKKPHGRNYESFFGTFTGVDGAKYTIKPMQGFIDKTGKLVTSIDNKKYYIYPESYNEGLIVFQHSNRRNESPYDNYPFGYMDIKGNIVINLIPGTQAMDSNDIADAKFSEGLAAIKIGGAWGYIDRKGEFVIKPQFQHAEPFRFGLAWVRVSNIKGHCYINKEGEIIFPKDSK